MTNPDSIEIHGEKTIVKLCKFATEHNMEGSTFTDIVERLFAEYNQLKASLPENPKYFSHDFNGDGFKYHDSLEEAQSEAAANLDCYRDQVSNGQHVENIPEFNELCYGLVIKSADHSVREVVTAKHHENDEHSP